jgi:hypothetical protein
MILVFVSIIAPPFAEALRAVLTFPGGFVSGCALSLRCALRRAGTCAPVSVNGISARSYDLRSWLAGARMVFTPAFVRPHATPPQEPLSRPALALGPLLTRQRAPDLLTGCAAIRPAICTLKAKRVLPQWLRHRGGHAACPLFERVISKISVSPPLGHTALGAPKW